MLYIYLSSMMDLHLMMVACPRSRKNLYFSERCSFQCIFIFLGKTSFSVRIFKKYNFQCSSGDSSKLLLQMIDLFLNVKYHLKVTRLVCVGSLCILAKLLIDQAIRQILTFNGTLRQRLESNLDLFTLEAAAWHLLI